MEAILRIAVGPNAQGAGLRHGATAVLFLDFWKAIGLDERSAYRNAPVRAVTQLERPDTLAVYFRFGAGIISE